jgi:hypothetical protein
MTALTVSERLSTERVAFGARGPAGAAGGAGVVTGAAIGAAIGAAPGGETGSAIGALGAGAEYLLFQVIVGLEKPKLGTLM